MNTFDMIIVGAGPAGVAAAKAARRRGLRAAVVSREVPGGTCVHRGCVPVKSLLASAAVCRMGTAGATDWPGALARAHEAAARLSRVVVAELERCGASFFLGEACIVGSNRVCVRPIGSPPFELCAKHVLFAGGATPCRPGFLPESNRIVDSDAALRLSSLPRRIVVLGGGAIGCEFASVFADFGAETTLVERESHLLPAVDRDCGVALAGAFSRRGVRIATGTDIFEVRETAEGLRVAAVDGRVFEADLLLVALGRRPVQVPAGVRVCGDVAGDVQLAPWAEASAAAAVAAICGEDHVFDKSAIPSCVFSFPEVATVGLSETDARIRGIPVGVGKASFRSNARAVASGDSDGFAKIVADSATGKLLGAAIVGPSAAESIAVATLAIRNGLSVNDLQATFPHPSFGETLADAAKRLV